jgi:hypothetical protein
MGLIKNTKEALTPAIKSQAAYALILQEGAIAMGDFTRTSDSATNVSKKLAGQWVEMQIVIGTALLPAFTALVTHLVDVVMPAITEFFEDPSWAAGAELAGEAVTSGFVKGLAGFTVAVMTAISTLGLVPAVNALWDRLRGDDDGAPAPAPAPGAPLGGRDDPDFDRGDAEEAAAAAAAAAVDASSAFLPSGDSINDLALAAIEAALAAALEAVAASAAEAARIAGFTEVDITGTGPGLEVVGGAAAAAAAGPTDAEVAAWLASPGAQAMFAGFTGDPGQRGDTTVIINAAAVTAPEVIDLMGKYVQANGPLSRQWIGQ